MTTLPIKLRKPTGTGLEKGEHYALCFSQKDGFTDIAYTVEGGDKTIHEHLLAEEYHQDSDLVLPSSSELNNYEGYEVYSKSEEGIKFPKFAVVFRDNIVFVGSPAELFALQLRLVPLATLDMYSDEIDFAADKALLNRGR